MRKEHVVAVDRDVWATSKGQPMAGTYRLPVHEQQQRGIRVRGPSEGTEIESQIAFIRGDHIHPTAAPQGPRSAAGGRHPGDCS